MAISLESLKDDTAKSKRTIAASVIMVSIIIHVVGGVGAAIWIVAKYLQPPEATFVAKKMVTLPPKIIDPKMAAAEFEAAAPKPVLDQKIASLRATDFALPDLPMMPTDTVVDFTPSTTVSADVSGMLGGLGGGSGGGSGGGGQGDGMSFFGLQSSGRSVIIIFDISKSVQNKAEKAGISIQNIRDETMKLIESLSINTTFNLFQFSRIYQPFAPAMMAPTQQNKDAAKQWLEKEFRTDGSLPRSVRGARTPEAGQDNGVTFVLKSALDLNPDVIYFISDASFQSENHSSQVPWSEVEDVIKNHKREKGSVPKLQFLGFEMKSEDQKEMRRIVRLTDGNIREM